jgi:hypothetical protein
MSGSSAFDLKCDPDGFIFAIDPATGDPVEGMCTELVTEKTADGIKVTQVTIVPVVTEEIGTDITVPQGAPIPVLASTCVWRKVGGQWKCV